MLFERNDLSYDWTEVVLLGQSEDHNTVTEPLLQGDVTERSFIPSEIYRRFQGEEGVAGLFVDVAMTKGGGVKETEEFRRHQRSACLRFGKLPNRELVLRRRNWCGGKIYLRSKGAKHRALRPASEEAILRFIAHRTFCALVRRSVSVTTLKTQQALVILAAPKFGIPFGSRVLSIEVLLP